MIEILVYFIKLLTLILLPLIGLALVSTTHWNNPIVVNKDGSIITINIDPDAKAKYIALLISIITFVFSLSLLVLFDPSTSEYQFTYAFGNKEALNTVFTSDFQLGVDGISLYFVVLTTFLFPISFLASWKMKSSESDQYNVKFYLCTLFALETLLILVFVVTDILLFYI